MRRLIIALILGGAFALPASGQDAGRGVLRPRTNERAIRTILVRIQTDTDSLRRTVDSNSRSGTVRRATDADVSYLINDLAQSTDELIDKLDRREVIRRDVDDVMRRGTQLDNVIASRSILQVRNSWSRLRRDLDSLASAYGMSWDWRNGNAPALDASLGTYQRLTGTYRLDLSKSDDPRRVVDRALSQLSGLERSRMAARIEDRLQTPEVIAIDRKDDHVTIASTTSPQVTFDADGRARVEPGFRSRSATTRATVYGDRLEVVTTGSGDNDFSATFEPLDNGDSLRVTKRLNMASLRQPVIVQSVYLRTSQAADWNVYDRASSEGGRWSNADNNLVPDGTTLVASLDEPLNLRTARRDDRVTLTVHNAASRALDNAVVEGYISSAPTDLNDSARLSIVFNQIRLATGRTAAFDGTIESVRGPNGEPISFNGEVVDTADPNQRDQAIQRGAIGAAVGAVIGAVAGGAKGAAIGAVIGGGGAAATVLIGDDQQRDLPTGTEFTIRSRSVQR